MPQIEDSYDVITTTLMNHHILPDEEFINFLKYVRRVGKKAFIFNDLYRSVPNYLMSYIFLNLLRGEIGTYTCYILDLIYRVLPFELISLPLKFAKELSNRPGNSLIVDGGIKSIEKAFTVSELKEMFRLAGYSNDSLSCEYYFIPGRLTCMVLLSDNHE